MQLWQLDVTASLFLADGREYKIISGIDDHSRYCVIATVLFRATGRAVCHNRALPSGDHDDSAIVKQVIRKARSGL